MTPERDDEKFTTGQTDNHNVNHEGNNHLEQQSEEDKALEEEFAALLDQHMPGSSSKSRGELIEVPVVAVREDSVLVDLGGKSEATVPIEDFPLIGGKRDVEAGQVIPVINLGRGDDGAPKLSHKLARQRQAQKNVREAKEQHVPIEGVVTRVVKGGVMVDVGLDAFMPASQIDLFRIPDLNALIGKQVEAYVIEFDDKRNRAVLSRRQLLFERRESERTGFLKDLEVGATVTGKVKSALDFGVFVNLGTVDGFIPREEISWDRGKSPADILKPGDEIELKILSISEDSGKITLSRKRLTENPWDKIDERFPLGGTVRGKVVAVQNYGAFLQVEEGITGMIHASDMSWELGNKKPEDYVKLGEEVTAQVLEIDRKKRRISLGLKQLSRDPWENLEGRFPVGGKAHGRVTSLTNYGAFVKLDEFVEGMVHVSDISWDKRVNHPKEHLKVGDEIDVKILKVDAESRRISLGIKQLAESPFDAFLKEHKTNDVVTGKVTRFAPFGAFVELAPGIEGLIHISQIDQKRVELPEKALELGEEVQVKIMKVERDKQKISLSRKEAMRHVEKERIKQYTAKKQDSPGGMSLGDAFRAAKEKQGEE